MGGRATAAEPPGDRMSGAAVQSAQWCTDSPGLAFPGLSPSGEALHKPSRKLS
jgi:hypothetical protein